MASRNFILVSNTMKTLTTHKSIVFEIGLSNDSKKTFVSYIKMERFLFIMYSFLTHGPFESLRNFFLVSNKAMKTLTTQKSIIWSGSNMFEERF